MELQTFRRIVTAFADSASDIDIGRGRMVVQIREEVLDVRLSTSQGELFVEEDGATHPAVTWLVNRVARLPLLADRIISLTSAPENFVEPSGRLLDEPNADMGLEEVTCSSASRCAIDFLQRKNAGVTSVLYLTSDAGEGKTTLINHLARKVASEYKSKSRDWLLVPIPLGGRTFLRFDDVVIAALVNRLRFQFFYFDAFLELVRLGVVVPAFDGFEEMIIESSAGEAISALGGLMRTLGSDGSILIAARKAFFDYRSFKTQARLFDTIGASAVAFARLALDRWTREHFIEYASLRAYPDPSGLFAAVAGRLGVDHPLLTRAVLVRRLVDVASAQESLDSLVSEIGRHPRDYFFQFVNAIVEREATEKWLDKSGEAAQQLLSTEEHHALLAMLAQEMWVSSTDALRSDLTMVVADVFSDSIAKPPAIMRQISERLKQHSLLVAASGPGSMLSFDHEDFRIFYLGEALGASLARGDTQDSRAMLRVGSLPRPAIEAAILHLKRKSVDARAAIGTLSEISETELSSSWVRENSGGLALALVSDEGLKGVSLRAMNFPEGALRSVSLDSVVVEDSYFHPTSLEGSTLRSCRFIRCRFERLEMYEGLEVGAILEDCEVGCLALVERSEGGVAGQDYEQQEYDPRRIASMLSSLGIVVGSGAQAEIPIGLGEVDDELRVIERALRVFLRSSQVNESVLRTKLGVKASLFLTEVLPSLERVGLFVAVPFLGAGNQRRFRLGRPMNEIQTALSRCNGSFEEFLGGFQA